jgi:hypothetical protein
MFRTVRTEFDGIEFWAFTHPDVKALEWLTDRFLAVADESSSPP